MNIHKLIHMSILTAGFAAFTLFGSAQAQQANPQQQMPATQETVEVTDEIMDKTADAYIVVIEIQQDVQEKMSGEKDQQKIQEHVQKAQKEMADAIEAVGLKTEEYESVMTQVTQDEDMRTKFVALLQEKRGES